MAVAKYYNLTVEDTDDEIIVRIDKTAQGRPSGSKKTVSIATMGKPKVVAVGADGQEIFLGVNCYKYPLR